MASRLNTQPLVFALLALFLITPGLQAKTLTFWQFWPQEWLNPELAKFEAETGIKVEVERLTWSEGYTKILTALAAGQGPDLVEIGSTWVAGFSSGLLPIEPGALGQSLNGWAPARYKEKHFAVPWTLSTGALYVNLDLLQKVGLPLPQDWESLYQTSAKIKALGPEYSGYGIKSGTYSTWQTFMPFAWSKGAKLISPDGQSTGLLDPNFLEAVQFYQRLRAVSLFDDNLVVRKAFVEGRLGLMMDEPGQIEKFGQENPNLHFKVIPLPPPVVGGRSVGFSGGQLLAITQDTQDKEATRQLIEFLVRPEVTEAITKRITTLFPAHHGALDSPFYQEQHKELLVFLKVLQDSTAPPSHPQWVGIQEVFSLSLERILYGLDTPQAGLAQADLEIKSLLEPPPRLARPKTNLWHWVLGALGGLLITWGLIASLLWLRAQKGQGSTQAQLSRRKLRYHRDTLIFLGPWLLVFLVFSLYPILHSLYLSFTDFRATDQGPAAWVGVGNYQRLLTDQRFLDGMGHSFWFLLGTVPIILILALVLAAVLNHKIKGRNFYRAAYFMPVVTSVMVIAALFVEVYAPRGLLNDLLGFLGLSGKHWLKDPNWALPSVMGMNIWASFGFYCLMLLAGLQNIPEEYYEASSLEGASKIRQFFTITLPLLKPTLLIAAIMDSILAFQVFGEILLMTGGGPLRSTETSVYYLYDLAFHRQEMGYGSAAAYAIFLVLLVFTAGQWSLSGSKEKAGPD